MQFTRIAADTFQTLQVNAGIIVDDFDPATGRIGNILGATTGGFSFSANPKYEDFGADVDNVPANTKQLKRLKSYDPAASGSFVTITPALARRLAGAVLADADATRVAPSHALLEADFSDVWIIGDYSDVNDGQSTAGYVALCIRDALNTGGFQWRTAKDGKGQFAFDFHGHYDLADPDAAPFELYIRAGTQAQAQSE